MVHAQLHRHKCEGQYHQRNTSHCTAHRLWWCVCNNTKYKHLLHHLHFTIFIIYCGGSWVLYTAETHGPWTIRLILYLPLYAKLCEV